MAMWGASAHAAAETVRFHVNAPPRTSCAGSGLGRDAILDAPVPDGQRRTAPTWRPSTSRDIAEATPQRLAAGSHLCVTGDPVPAGPLTMGLWLRLWRLPVIDVVQWAWPARHRPRLPLTARASGSSWTTWALVYAGDGGAFDHASGSMRRSRCWPTAWASGSM
ncbi:MAG: hypothetical protein R3C32_15250 [Chloroflexota bacterium]